MGGKLTRKKMLTVDSADVTQLSEKEWRILSDTLHVNEKTGVADKSRIKEQWGHIMGNVLLETWILYIFGDSSDHIDRNRLAYLYKAQTSLYADVKAGAVIRINTNADPRGPLPEGVSFEKVDEYFFFIMASYLRCLGYYKNTEFIEWLKKDALTSVTTLKNVSRNMTSSLKKSVDKSKGNVCRLAVEEFFRANRLISEVFDNFVKVAYGLGDLGPKRSVLPNINPRHYTCLDIGEVMFLCSHLVKSWTRFWRLRFQNKGHGSNFTMLCEMISNVGPTIIVVKDTAGHVFGCCASESWRPASSFYGDCRSFLFQLKPTLKFYAPSSYNQNFQYHNQNQHMLPNGFGMGGRIGAWGFWIDGDFGKGHSADFCGTFQDYARLSAKEEFLFDHIEVWSIDETETDYIQWSREPLTLAYSNFYHYFQQEEEITIRKKSKSIIDSNQLKNALLQMAGKEIHST